MKRILSLVLAALMLLTCISAMASCSSEETKTEAKTEEKTEKKTKESSTAAKSSAAASTAAKPAATQAPATQAPATQAPATQAPATQAPVVTAPTQQPSVNLPAGLQELTPVAVPSLVGTEWAFFSGSVNGMELTPEMIGNAGIRFESSTSVALLSDDGEDSGSYEINTQKKYIRLFKDGEEYDMFAVFTTVSGQTILALSSPAEETMVLLFAQVSNTGTPSAPSTDEEVPEFLQQYLTIASPLPALDGTTWTLVEGVNGGIEMDPATIEAMDLSLSFAGTKVALTVAGDSAEADLELTELYFYMEGNGIEFYGIYVEAGGDSGLALISPDYEGDYLVLAQN